MPILNHQGTSHYYPSTGDGVTAWKLDKERVSQGKKPKFSLDALRGRSMRTAVRSELRRIRNAKRGISSNGH